MGGVPKVGLDSTSRGGDVACSVVFIGRVARRFAIKYLKRMCSGQVYASGKEGEVGQRTVFPS